MNAVPHPEESLAAYRDKSARLTEVAAKANADGRSKELAADRLKAEAAQKEATARTALENLYADRADGRNVTSAQINKAAAALSAAVEEAKRAGPEEAGFRAAAAKAYARAANAQNTVASLKSNSKGLFRTAMHERIRMSCKAFDAAVAEFTVAYTHHHAEMNAIEAALQQHGFPYGDAEFFANRGSVVIELPVTRTKSRPYNFSSIDVSKQLQKEMDRIAAELRALIP